MFTKLYHKVLALAEHRYANAYLAAVSFVESSVFPIPPDIMLVPMVMANPKRAWFYFSIATLFSVLGGFLGYAIGYFFMESIGLNIIASLGYAQNYEVVMSWFEEYGVWMVLIAGFTPIPYKLFTLSAGAMSMSFGPFVVASIFGRGLRFFIVATLVKYCKTFFEKYIVQYLEQIGWIVVSLLLLGFLYYQFSY